jgi:hypothetical protein
MAGIGIPIITEGMAMLDTVTVGGIATAGVGITAAGIGIVTGGIATEK